MLAGTNDLGSMQARGGRKPIDVLVDVLALHAFVHAANVTTVAVTLPQPAFEAVSGRRHATVAYGRATINYGLHALAARSNATVLLAEADAELANLDASESERVRRWERDGVHFTPAGYDELGGVVHRTLLRAGVQPCGTGNATGTAFIRKPAQC